MKIVLKVAITCKKCKTCVLGIASKVKGIKSLTYDDEKSTLTVVGDVDVVVIVEHLRKAKHPAEVSHKCYVYSFVTSFQSNSKIKIPLQEIPSI
ncbi:unnamed protein product [Miscanthus lutarioriparius]|uniref:HMA domain-containing protein n=1 Tax=Miscanthus lutarioriparius TaxID=422564 RepID=A0A811P7R6_9POAL|nr:unnamed protein product [Miscanthus lutarioriparius]CAD6237450.1 unnamed protein product [Miscanthus lutarioriparius]